MSEPCNFCKSARCIAYGIAIVGAFLIVGGLVYAMRHYTQAPSLTQARAQTRAKNLQDLRAASTAALNEYAWQDKTKGVVRIPVARALELTLQEWKNPAQARSNLIMRVDQATAAPPKEPEKPSAFE